MANITFLLSRRNLLQLIPLNSLLARVGFAGLFILSVGAASALAAEGPVFPPLTSVSGNPRLPGKFVWADLVTDDVPAACKFYGELFGWRFKTLGNYTLALNGERPLAGLFHHERPKDTSGHPRWFGYISVPNVERAQKKVTRLHGRIVAPTRNFPQRGEQAVFADPEGALFGVIKSTSGDPEDFLAEPGDWIWIQLLSHDAPKAAEFYRGIAGYDVVENTEKNRVNDYVLVSKGYARATVRTIPAGNVEVKPTWLTFVRVTSVVDSCAKAKQLGGEVRIEPKPELLGGKVAVVTDPSGAAIGLLEWSQDAMKGGR